MRRVLAAAGGFFYTFILGVTLWFGYCFAEYGWLTQQCETTNGTFKMRAQHYSSFPLFRNSYFVFQVSPAGGGWWREVAVYPYDEFEITIPLPCEQMRFVNNDTGYFFMEWVGIAVTRDGGRTWSLWRPSERERGIERVAINPDGTGTATLWSYSRQLERRLYHTAWTDNYGQNWHVEP